MTRRLLFALGLLLGAAIAVPALAALLADMDWRGRMNKKARMG